MANSRRGLAWLVGRPWFWAIAIAVLFLQPLVRTFLRERPQLPPVGAQLSPFELVRETGARFGTRELTGRVWIASFAPTDDGARELGASLAKVQRRLRHMGDSYRIVTFATDPARDTVAAEAALARSLHANPRAWCFVTGDAAALASVAADFHYTPGRDLVTLVDQAGRVRGQYDPRLPVGEGNQKGQDALVADLGLLVNSY
jgi:protein SCO1/2